VVRTYQFDGVCVDLARLAVSRAGTPVALEPKAFDVLRFLIEHRERLVTKDELLDAVWRDTFVTPNVLTRAVAQLRKALGDDAQEARYIETVTRRGYCFIALVTIDTPPSTIAVPADLASADRAPAHSALADRASVDRAPADRAAADIASADCVSADRAAADIASADRALADSAPADRAAAGRAAAGRASADTASGARAAAARAAADIASAGSASADPAPAGSASAVLARRWPPLAVVAVSVAAIAVIAVIAVAGWLLRARFVDPAAAAAAAAAADPHAPRAWMPSSRRITTRNGYNASPALSPDGRAIAYVSDRSGALEIYVVGLAPGSQEIAITNDSGQNMEPVWSPDGQWIAFHSRARGGVWVAPSTGGPPRQIADTGSHPAWSPDGQSIAFTSSEGSTAGQSVIRIAARDGSHVRGVTRLGEPVGGHISPSWSNSGRFLAFAVSNGVSAKSIWVVPAAGGAPRRLTDMAGADSPQFGPGDRDLFFQGWEAGANSNNRLFRLPLDAAQAMPAGPLDEVLSLENGLFAGLSIARDGTLAYGLQTTDANLWAIDLRPDGSASDPRRLTDDAIRAARPEYSKDGRITYSQLGTGRPASVWLMRDDASNREPLSTDGPASFATWSGDNRRVLVLCNSGNLEPTLWWIDVATRRTSPLHVSGDGVRGPHVSPDGRELAFWVLEPNGAMNVWTQAIDGSGSRRRVTADAEAVTYPSWSPDGRWLAVEIKRGEQTHIGVVAKDGGPIEQITNERGQSWPHSWSPDGDRIAFAAERDGVWNIHTVSRRTHVSQPLTHFTSSSGYVRYPSWSPRGNRIVFERETHQSGIWTVQVR
jgi:Tol biopolymer transport system component/DNA-binding winged helix-turn-helix (wHTH) protein